VERGTAKWGEAQLSGARRSKVGLGTAKWDEAQLSGARHI
jgi:hypothetical protein